MLKKTARSLKVTILKKIHVPGAFEIPFAAKKMFKDKKINAVVVLGAVIQGKTDHDIIIVNAVSQKLLDLSLNYNKPVGFGIIGPRVSWQQAQDRSLEYSKRALKSAVEMVKIE